MFRPDMFVLVSGISGGVSPNDDLAREALFHANAKDAVEEVFKSIGRVHDVPKDCRWVKTPEHMMKIAKTGQEAFDEKKTRQKIKQDRILKKNAPQVQKDVLEKRRKERKKIEDDGFDIEVEDDMEDVPARRMQRRTGSGQSSERKGKRSRAPARGAKPGRFGGSKGRGNARRVGGNVPGRSKHSQSQRTNK